ncbi:hypothetical protein [Natrinema salinisoli]|uniref:hypothetical protein n=1 Tax=Natrinema salinisoli TaxID=2878535 RepID=UPI001CF0166E|nr:hypothetical protein [Natrinema salinisoli]
MSDDQEGTEASGSVTDLYRSSSENKPHGVHVDGTRYTTFNDEDVEEIGEGVTIQFRYVENGDHRNIVPGSVEIVEESNGPETYGDTAGEEPFSMNDARIGAQSALRSAVLHHQHREDSTDEDVIATAQKFADAQADLYRKLRNTGQGETQ